VQWCGVNWRDLCKVIFFWSEVKWVTVKFLATIVLFTLGWTYTAGTWLDCDYFIWCVSCTVVVLTCFVMCGVFWDLCGCFSNMCTCIYCVFYCLYCVFVLLRLSIFILIGFVGTSVRTTATEWKLSCSKYNNNNNNNKVKDLLYFETSVTVNGYGVTYQKTWISNQLIINRILQACAEFPFVWEAVLDCTVSQPGLMLEKSEEICLTFFSFSFQSPLLV
jgi:hypothetical protein